MKQISKVVGCVIIVGLLLVVLGAVPVAAAPCDVPSSAYPTIQAAVDDATCFIINVAAGTYTEHIVIDHNVMIHGAGADSTIVDGSGNGPVFLIGNGINGTVGDTRVTITGVTIQNGRSDNTGGGIETRGALTVMDSTISGNTGGDGGGIDSHLGTLTVRNSTISGNSAFFSGGGINNSGGTLTVYNSTISDNTGVNGGGGIATHFSYTPTAIYNSTISDNTAVDGGGISTNDTVMLTHVTFENNTPNDCTGCP